MKQRRFKPVAYDCQRPQKGGWRVVCIYMVSTTAQFTAEQNEERASSQWLWLAVLRAKRKARSAYYRKRATPEQRKNLGWS